MLCAMRSRTMSALGPLPAAYAKLLAGLARLGWIGHGTVVCRPLRRKVGGQWVDKGPYYLWTCKRQGKTVCYALSKAQYQVAKEAIAANRCAMETVAKIQEMTLRQILKKVPGVTKRK
jgi:hypothetical protein